MVGECAQIEAAFDFSAISLGAVLHVVAAERYISDWNMSVILVGREPTRCRCRAPHRLVLCEGRPVWMVLES